MNTRAVISSAPSLRVPRFCPPDPHPFLILFRDAYWTQVWAQSLHLQVMPSDEGAAVAVNWMRLLEHLGQDFVSVALTGSRLVSSVIGDPLFLFSGVPPPPCGQERRSS